MILTNEELLAMRESQWIKNMQHAGLSKEQIQENLKKFPIELDFPTELNI